MLLTIAEAAALLQVKRSWLYARTCRGEIPHLKLGGLLRFDSDDLKAWLEAQKRGASDDGSGSHGPTIQAQRDSWRGAGSAVTRLSRGRRRLGA